MTKQEIINKIKQRKISFRDISKKYRTDKDVVIAAVANSGQALQYTSEKLRNDKDVVLEAVKNDGTALKYTSDNLLNDKDFIMTVSKIVDFRIEYLPIHLMKDKMLVNDLIKNSNGNLKTPYKIVLQKSNLRIIADGPMYELYPDRFTETFNLLNVRVEDLNGNILSPIIEELEVLYHFEVGSAATLFKGFVIIDGVFYYEKNLTNTNRIDLYTIKPAANIKCTEQELEKYLEPCKLTKFDDKKAFSSYVFEIYNFQSNYQVRDSDKNKLSWDGSILILKA
jgi:hypothetical protein